MASLTTKHLFALMVLNANTSLSVEMPTVEHLKNLGLVTERRGFHLVTTKGKDIIKRVLNEANLSILCPTTVEPNAESDLRSEG